MSDKRTPPEPHHNGRRAKEILPGRAIVADAYTDPDRVNENGKHTLHNKTQSYLAGYPNASYETARGPGQKKVFEDPLVQNRIRQNLEDAGFGQKERGNILAQIGRGELTREVQRIDKEGKVVTITVEPTNTERIKAIEVANRMDGTNDEARIAGEVAKKNIKEIWKDQRAQMKKKQKDVTPVKQEEPVPEGAEDLF